MKKNVFFIFILFALLFVREGFWLSTVCTIKRIINVFLLKEKTIIVDQRGEMYSMNCSKASKQHKKAFVRNKGSTLR